MRTARQIWRRLELGWRAGLPGANGPTLLVPGERAGQLPESRPGPGTAAPGGPAAGDRSGADAGGAPAAPPTTSPSVTTTTTVPPGALDPVDDLLGPVVSTLLP